MVTSLSVRQPAKVTDLGVTVTMAPAPPTVLERLLILPNIGRTFAAFWLRLLWRPFLRGAHQKRVLKDALYALIRSSLQLFSIAQEQFIYPSTATVYKMQTKRNGVKRDVQTLKSGITINWLGDRDAETVFLFFHGGGYVLPATPGHMQFQVDLYKAISKGKSFAIAGLQYTLAPEKQYPGQLIEAAAALEFLLVDQKRKPSQIFVGGDSAGGNLAMALISHLLHPHSQVTDLKQYITEPLAGAVLISPWVQWLPAGGSAETKTGSDIVSRSVGERWSKAVRGLSQSDNYQEPAIAEQTWFKDLDSVVKDILIWGGEAEMLIDSIVRFAKLIESVHKSTETVVQPGAGHEDFITCRTLHIVEKDDHAKLIEAWLQARV